MNYYGLACFRCLSRRLEAKKPDSRFLWWRDTAHAMEKRSELSIWLQRLVGKRNAPDASYGVFSVIEEQEMPKVERELRYWENRLAKRLKAYGGTIPCGHFQEEGLCSKRDKAACPYWEVYVVNDILDRHLQSSSAKPTDKGE